MPRILIALSAVAVLLAGCNTPGARLNAPPHGEPYETADLQGTFVYMTDNALLADMTICDIHFLPHRALLNDLGISRLSRLASLIDAYGGTVRYSTNLEDEDLVSERMAVATDFLAQSGVDTTQDVVVLDIPGGDGMYAAEAVIVNTEEGRYKAGRSKTAAAASDKSGPQ